MTSLNKIGRLRSAGLAVILVLACGRTPQSPSGLPRPTGFPLSCLPEQVQVMLLGTYHMANPGLDVVKQDIDDVLSPHRQAEIEQLVARLAEWGPQQVAVEHLYADSAALREQYARYRKGELAPDRNETVQIGFRLANILGHPDIHAIDYQMRIGNDSVEALYSRRPDLKENEAEFTRRLQARTDSAGPAMRRATVSEQLRVGNSDEQLHGRNSFGMFGALMPAGEGANYGGPLVLAKWYERNIRMVHHLHRILRPETKRMLVLVGSGHVPPMRNILDEDPRFCPISPLPYLQ